MRVLPVQSLDEAQRNALRAIREGVIAPGAGSPVMKVIPLSSRNYPNPANPNEPFVVPGAIERITSGDPRFGGYFARRTDVQDAVDNGGVVNRMRLDYDGSPLSSNEPYAVLETSLTPAVAGNVKIPVGTLPPGADPNLYTMRSDQPPFTGNGFAGSLDGHLTPEWRVAEFPGPPDVTIMRFKNADGSPRQVSMGPAGASDRWVLKPRDPNDLSRGYFWEPLP